MMLMAMIGSQGTAADDDGPQLQRMVSASGMTKGPTHDCGGQNFLWSELCPAKFTNNAKTNNSLCENSYGLYVLM